MLHDVTGHFINVQVFLARTCETLGVRERLLGRNMHIGHRRDSTGHHVTEEREHLQRLTKELRTLLLQSNVTRKATVGSTLTWAE